MRGWLARSRGSLTACVVLPVGLIVSHLPFGPTAYFTLCNVVMRHDIPDLGTASEAKPHLIIHGFSSRLGKRVSLWPWAGGWVLGAGSWGCEARHLRLFFLLP